MMYGSECWEMRNTDVQRMEVAERKMIRWSLGLTLKDKVKNEEIFKRMKVRNIGDKLVENRLRWYGHVQRRPDEYVGKVAQRVNPGSKKAVGNPGKRWQTNVKNDLQRLRIDGQDALDRLKWKKLICMADPR